MIAAAPEAGQQTASSGDVSPIQAEVLELLTRRADEDDALHALRIAFAPGSAGALARKRKLAELESQLASDPSGPHAPDLAWARRHILAGQMRLGDRREPPVPAPQRALTLA